MAAERQRISVDPALWEAVVAVAKAQKVHPSTLVERALQCYLDPRDVIEKAAKLVRQYQINQSEIRDMLHVISDEMIDRASRESYADDAVTGG